MSHSGSKVAVAIVIFLLLVLVPLFALAQMHPNVPRDAYKYQRMLTGQARQVWGLEAPIATFAAQIHQESYWRPTARSPYAEGLTQFTPDTAKWIGQVFPELRNPDVYNPSWAIAALVRYDRWLWGRVGSPLPCDRMAFALAGYNGGAGWIDRERKAAPGRGYDPSLWFGHVENVCLRAGWACKENRDYPRRILHLIEPWYETWGPRSCGETE